MPRRSNARRLHVQAAGTETTEPHVLVTIDPPTPGAGPVAGVALTAHEAVRFAERLDVAIADVAVSMARRLLARERAEIARQRVAIDAERRRLGVPHEVPHPSDDEAARLDAIAVWLETRE